MTENHHRMMTADDVLQPSVKQRADPPSGSPQWIPPPADPPGVRRRRPFPKRQVKILAAGLRVGGKEGGDVGGR